SWPIGASRQQQPGAAATRKPLAVDVRNPPRGPGGHRLLAGSPRGTRIMLRQADLEPPFPAGSPAALAQIGRGRAECVGDGIDEVLAAIAIEIDGDAQESRGHELGVAERPRPGPVELGGIDVAVLNYPEVGDEA